MIFNTLTLALIATPLSAFAANFHGAVNHTRHADVARRQVEGVDLQKRFAGSKWSFYDVGLGACGEVNSPDDFIVALNAAQFGEGFPGPNCFKTITMTYNGKTASARITDRCPGCPFGGLDLSRGLFRFFAAESAGIIHGEWNFGSAPPPPPKPPVEPPKPKPTTTWKPEPTTTWKPEPSTTWTSESKSSSSAARSSSSAQSSSSTSLSSSASTTSSSVAPSATPSSAAGNLAALNQAALQMGYMVVGSARR